MGSLDEEFTDYTKVIKKARHLACYYVYVGVFSERMWQDWAGEALDPGANTYPHPRHFGAPTSFSIPHLIQVRLDLSVRGFPHLPQPTQA